MQRKFSNIVGPETRDICYATQNRQSAVRELSKLVDVILVVGAKNSSNSNRLREIGSEEGLPSYLIADGSELDAKWLEGKETVGISVRDAGNRVAALPEQRANTRTERLVRQRGGQSPKLTCPLPAAY